MTRPEVFAALTPERIAAYLTRRGWVEFHPHGVHAVLRFWTCGQHQPPHEVRFPASNHWSDYARSITWDLGVVADCEGRPSPDEQVARSIAEEGEPTVCHGDCPGCSRPDCRYDHDER